MPFNKIQSEGLDLSDDFAFTGTVTGAGSNGLVRLGGASATGQNVGDVSFDLFTTSYDFYFVTFAVSYVSATTCWVRLRSSSSYLTGGNYAQGMVGIRSDGSARNIVHATSTYFQLGSSAEASASHNSHAGSLLFQKPMVSSKTTQMNMQCTVLDTSGNVIDKTGGGVYLATGSHNGFGIMGGANLDEYNIQVFGVSQT
jgi:hypothetical protein